MNKKTRFEVFKRDGFACAYCGKSPPQVTLEVDHIEPIAKGGENDFNNYITACFDCNRGKRDIPLCKAPLQLSENLEVLKEKETQLDEYRKFVRKIENRIKREIADVDKIFQKYYEGRSLSQNFKKRSVKKFLSLLLKHEVVEAMKLAVEKDFDDPEDCVKYFCGICWRKINKDV